MSCCWRDDSTWLGRWQYDYPCIQTSLSDSMQKRKTTLAVTYKPLELAHNSLQTAYQCQQLVTSTQQQIDCSDQTLRPKPTNSKSTGWRKTLRQQEDCFQRNQSACVTNSNHCSRIYRKPIYSYMKISTKCILQFIASKTFKNSLTFPGSEKFR